MRREGRPLTKCLKLLLMLLVTTSCSDATLVGSSQVSKNEQNRSKSDPHALNEDDPSSSNDKRNGNGIDDYPSIKDGNVAGGADDGPGKGPNSGSNAGDGTQKNGNPSENGSNGKPGDKGGSNGEAPAVGKAGALVEASDATCLLDKAEHYRILLVLDSSGSTGKTDPANIRRQAGLQLTAQFTDYVTANPQASVDMAIVDFSETARIGNNGWVRLSQANKAKIDQDIHAGTENPGKGTFFDKGIEAALDLFIKSSPVDMSRRQRNFILFLSDGQANGPKNQISDIAPPVTELAKNHGVAIFSILIGSKPEKTASDTMQALALPVQGIVAPEHVGSYFYAPNAETIRNAFSSFFKHVAKCKS